jgi:ornithine carbamoyltransferase
MERPAVKPLMNKDMLSVAQLSRPELETIFATAARIKANPREFMHSLEGQVIVLLFEKDSLRTLVSFEAGMARLGGRAVYLDHRVNRIGQREPIRDYARNLERWVRAIVARTYEHSTVAELAAESRAPVINALSDLEHPCQALADYFTLLEKFGELDGLSVAYVGDGNNVCHSLMLGAAILGVRLTVITPPGFAPRQTIIDQTRALAQASGAAVAISNDPKAVVNHQAVYTDTWTSMGQESESARREQAFANFQVTEALMDLAGRDAVFMHCLPAHRGQEVAAGVIDGPRSIVYDQAENRMHAQNAVLLHMLGADTASPSRSKKPARAVSG